MTRRILGNALIGLSAVLLVISAAGMILSWVYNEPLTRRALERLEKIDAELEQVEVTLTNSREELERTLRIVTATEAALNKFTLNDPKGFFEDVQSTLDDRLVPELETARGRLIAARDTLENLRVTLFGLNLIPFLEINIPDRILTDLIDSAEALESEIANVSRLAAQASIFLEDASYLLSGDFGETKDSLEYFLSEIHVYEDKVAGWRSQVADLRAALPGWLDRASIFLTIFLFWFGFCQYGMILHGVSLRRGGNPFAGWREFNTNEQ
jgi:hypothetical protein